MTPLVGVGGNVYCVTDADELRLKSAANTDPRTLRSIAARAKRNEDAARLDPHRWGRSAMAPAAVARRLGERRRAIEVHHVTDEELLTKLTQLRMAAGRLSTSIIDAAPGLPSAGCYRRRFGSLLNAYAAIGYQFPEWRAMGAQSRWGPPSSQAAVNLRLERCLRT